MRNITLTAIIALLMPLTASAQDDMYFVPSKQKNEAAKAERRKSHETYYSGISKTDDEYNRRTHYVAEPRLLLENDSTDIIEFQAGPQAYPDTIEAGYDPDDFAFSRSLSRFDDYYYGWYDPWFYSNYYWGTPFWAWRAYDPWYNPWYGPWYDPFYDPWYDPFYRPWAFNRWGYGYYSPWGYRPWGYYPPVIAYYPAVSYNNPRERAYSGDVWAHRGTIRGNGGSHTGGMHSGDTRRLGNGITVAGSRRGGSRSVDVARRNGDVTNRATGRQQFSSRSQESQRNTYYNNDNSYRNSSSSSFGGSRSSSFGGGGGSFGGGGSHGSRGSGGRSTGRR